MNQLRKKLSSSSPFAAHDSTTGKANMTSPINKQYSSHSQSQSQSQAPVFLDVFKDHWKQMLFVFNKSLVADDDINTVKNHLGQMINLLLDELDSIHLRSLNNESKKIIKKSLRQEQTRRKREHDEEHLDEIQTEEEKGDELGYEQTGEATCNQNENESDAIGLTLEFPFGQIWDYMSKNNIFETIYLWSLSYPEYLYELKYEQLRSYENLLNHMQTNEQTSLLLCGQLHEPLFALLNHCSTHNSEPIEKHMIVIINQLCVCMCKNSTLLRIFVQRSKRRHLASPSNVIEADLAIRALKSSIDSTSGLEASKNIKATGVDRKFFIFSLLIPYIHREGCLGNFNLLLFSNGTFFFLSNHHPHLNLFLYSYSFLLRTSRH
jgi:hypothetical protein